MLTALEGGAGRSRCGVGAVHAILIVSRAMTSWSARVLLPAGSFAGGNPWWV